MGIWPKEEKEPTAQVPQMGAGKDEMEKGHFFPSLISHFRLFVYYIGLTEYFIH